MILLPLLTASVLTDINIQVTTNPSSFFFLAFCAESDVDDQIMAKFKILLNEYRRMFDQSLFKSKDLYDMLRFLPGVVVQKDMGLQGMAHLYRIKPDLLECLIKSTIEPLRPYPTISSYKVTYK